MKTSIRITAFLLTAALLTGVFAAAVDPVVTRSYLTETYQPYIMNQTREKLGDAFAALEEKLSQYFAGGTGRAAVGAGVWKKVMGGVRALTDGSYSVSSGAVVSGGLGTTISLVSGSAQVIASGGAALVDLTNGADCVNGTALAPGHLYIIADDAGVGVRASGSGSVLAVSGSAVLLGGSSSGYTGTTTPSKPGAYTERYLKYAQALQEMGLFKGTNTGFELTREATRVEALVMLIRLLGEEEAALASKAKHPFRDVPAWADRYVAYAYDKGYTNGISKKEYGSAQSATREQYLTFLLRALGYDDAAGDFVWSKASEKAMQIGMLTGYEVSQISTVFYRDQVAFTSYKALMTPRKNASVRLLDILIDSGAVEIDAAYRATVIVG